MNALRMVFRLGLLIGLATEILVLPTTAQTTPPKEAQPAAPGLRKLSGDDANRAEELNKAIEVALKADRWNEAIARAEELLALRARAQGPKHFETVNAEWSLKALRRVASMPKVDRVDYQSARSADDQAKALYAQGKHTLARPLFEKALEIRRRLLTDNHPDTATSYNNLADNLDEEGKFAVSQPLYEKALEIRRRLLTDDHPDTATSYNDVALNLKVQGKSAQAQPLYERALEIRRRLFTDEHPDTANSYNNLAMDLDAQGKYPAAQPLHEKALEINRRLLTDDHRETASTYNNLAMNLDAQGKYAQAQPLHEKALRIFRRLLSDDHPFTATSYNNVAANLRFQGKYALAQPLLENALEIRRRGLTDDHPVTALSYGNLAMNLADQGMYAQAQPLAEKALEIHRRRLTDDHPLTAASYDRLANNLKAQGKYSQAQPLYEKALEIRRRLLTDDHPDTATSYNNVASNLDAQGKYAAAQPLYEKALEIFRRLLTDDHPKTASCYNNVASNLAAQGKYLQARDQWLSAVKSLDKARLRVAFAGLERAGRTKEAVRPALAAVLARLGQPAQAWQSLEEDLGRGLLDELAARQDRRLAPAERDSLRKLTAELERLDRLVETTPKDLGKAERAKRFEELKNQRELASIALGEFQTKLVQDHDALAGQAASLSEIQAALPADAALVAWVDIPPAGPNAADPDGEHWGVVVRSRGTPAWVAIAGAGPDGSWTEDDIALAGRLRTELRKLPAASATRLAASARKVTHPAPRAAGHGALKGLRPPPTAGRPAARRLIVSFLQGNGGHPGRGPARPQRHPDGELRPLGHRPHLPPQATPARPTCWPARLGRPDLRASRHVERPGADARPWIAGQVRDPRLQRRDPRLESWGCLAGLQRQPTEQERRPQDRGRERQADRRRHLERRPVVPARTGAGRARRGARSPAGCGSDRRESSDEQGAPGGAGRRRLCPLAGYSL